MSDVGPVGAEVAANAWLYAAVLLAVGVCATRWWLHVGVRSSLSGATVEQLEHRLARLGLRVATTLAIALVARMWAHTISTFGWSASLSWDALLVVGMRSRWGHRWQLQMAAALALVGASLHSLHVLGAGLWLGTLAVLLAVSRPAADSTGRRMANEAITQAFLPRFSPIAVSGMATLAVAGAATACFYVGSLSNLWTTLYGRVLSAKILLFVGVGLCVWFNWRQFSNAAAWEMREADSAAALRRRHVLPLVEVCLTAAVVILTGLLTQLEHP